MVSVTYKSGTVYAYTENGYTTQKEAEVWLRSEDMDKLPKKVPNGTPAIILDWNNLDSAKQAELKSQIWVYDAQGETWYPFG